jgi:hypothetical protein
MAHALPFTSVFSNLTNEMKSATLGRVKTIMTGFGFAPCARPAQAAIALSS